MSAFSRMSISFIISMTLENGQDFIPNFMDAERIFGT